MSGDYQHFIPQHVLKGFATRGPDGTRSVWVFRKDEEPELKPIKSFGGDIHFYSPPAEEGSETLDTKITRYENRLAGFVRNLRKQQPGMVLNPEIPAEIIAHLTMRAESTRAGLTFASKLLVMKAMEVFGDEQNLKSIFGLDGDQPAALFQEHLLKLIEEHPELKQSGLPPQAIERVLFGYLKENFPKFFQEHKPVREGMLAGLYLRADEMVRDGHNKSLEKTLVSEVRVQKLSQMRWTILNVNNSLVLPDCVAISIDSSDRAKPYLLQDSDEIAVVAMPLTSNRLLLGKISNDKPFNLALFNLRAIACSENFFVSSEQSAQFGAWSKYIGIEPKTLMYSTVQGVFSEYVIEKTDIEKNAGSAPTQETIEGPPSWQISFHNCADEPTAKQIGNAVSRVFTELRTILPLNRIDGITFAQDYPSALQNLDRGFPAAEPLTTTSEEGAVGVAMAPIVLRDKIVKVHIVLQGFIGHLLISEEAEQQGQGYHILIGALVEAACTEIFDTALPGVLLKRIDNPFDSCRFAGLSFAWCSYISARFSAKFAQNSGGYLRDFLVAAIDKAIRDIPEIRFAYRFHGDVKRLMDATFERIKPILQHAARMVGHFDGLEQSPFEQASHLQEVLERHGLRQWFDMYERDLRKFWDRLGQWESFDEFLQLGGHVERLFWQFGMVLWQTEDGDCRIEVPIATDLQRLIADSQVSKFVGPAPTQEQGRLDH